MPNDIEEIILDELKYLRNKIDKMESTLHGIMWKVMGIGSASGALGYIIGLIVNKSI